MLYCYISTRPPARSINSVLVFLAGKPRKLRVYSSIEAVADKDSDDENVCGDEDDSCYEDGSDGSDDSAMFPFVKDVMKRHNLRGFLQMLEIETESCKFIYNSIGNLVIDF
jgi:hypothetical protein